MESGNHLSGDLSLLEDKSQIRSGCEPANNAALNNLVLALIKRSGKFATVLEGMTHYTANREAALEALLTRRMRLASPRARERPGGKGGDLPARQPQAGEASNAPGEPLARPRRRRDRIRPTLQLIQKGPWGILNLSKPNHSTLRSGIGRQRGISSCRKSKPRRGRRARSRLSRQSRPRASADDSVRNMTVQPPLAHPSEPPAGRVFQGS